MHSAETSGSSSSGRWIWMLFGVAAVLRVVWVFVRWGDAPEALNFPDEEAYLTVARSLAAGKGLVDEFGFRSTYMPAYPAFIAAFGSSASSLFLLRVTQAILAAWVAPATYLLAREFYRDRLDNREHMAAVIAGSIVAFDPFLIFFSGLLLTEAFFAAVLVSAWIFVMAMKSERRTYHVPAIGAGVLLWLSVMLRPSAIVLVISLPIVLRAMRGRARRQIGSSLIVVAIVAVGLFPWVLRNRMTIGEWRWLTTRGGISLYDGVQAGASGASDLAHTKTAPEIQTLNETQWDEYWRTLSYRTIAADPLRIIKLGWQKLIRTWSLTPNVETYRQGKAALVSAVYMIVVLLSSAVGIIIYRRQAQSIVLLLMPVIIFTLLHMVYVGSVRYRVPVMPMLAVLSGAGLANLMHVVFARRQCNPCNQD